ncbi:unnamed protein product [Spirodela intermedia]|uniref:Uncharacterized protein n=1 Tax=Spirodela intermedia TaxID=51605 RepID=A0A7I8JA67_SPIIN|nr:unnamed protein product [Spirodela intermedia]CAA6667118.1 unnamed protein product [Spirodela intermedia]
MGAQNSVHGGKVPKIDYNVDLTHKLFAPLLVPISGAQHSSSSPLSLVIGRLCIKHPDLFGGNEKLDVSWDKGCSTPPSSSPSGGRGTRIILSPGLGFRGPGWTILNPNRSAVHLCRFSAGVDICEPASTNWISTTEHQTGGRSISRDIDGFPITCSGGPHDNMVILKQESSTCVTSETSFSKVTGGSDLSRWLIFNKFKFSASSGVRFGRLTGGSIVGTWLPTRLSDRRPGQCSWLRDGAISSGRSFLVVNSELTILWQPALRQGKPGKGLGGAGLRGARRGQIQLD